MANDVRIEFGNDLFDPRLTPILEIINEDGQNKLRLTIDIKTLPLNSSHDERTCREALWNVNLYDTITEGGMILQKITDDNPASTFTVTLTAKLKTKLPRTGGAPIAADAKSSAEY